MNRHLVRDPERIRPLGKVMCKLKDNIKWIFRGVRV
jgi:hypothetical protein